MKKQLKILIIEDSEDDALLDVFQIKKGGYEVDFKRVESSKDLVISLCDSKWDIILSDYKMPGFNGLEALSIVKESGIDIPFIIISGTIGEDLAVTAMKSGAHDYIMKDNLQRLLPAVERELRESNNRAKQRRLELQEKLLVEERLSHITFFENMDKINRAIQSTNDLEQMLNEVLEIILTIFKCDRAILQYPCDPNAQSWYIPVEKSIPEYSIKMEEGTEITMENDVAQSFKILLESKEPVVFGSNEKHSIPISFSEYFVVKSNMSMVVYPKIGKPWQFGIHQCSTEKTWNTEDIKLFKEIGTRLTEGLTSLLLYKEKSKSEAENKAIVNAIPDLLFRINEDGEILDYRKPSNMQLYMPPNQFLGKKFFELLPPDIANITSKAINKTLKSDEITAFEYSLPIDEQKHYFEGRVTRISSNNLLLVVRDITEKRKSEEELKLSEERFAKVFRLSPVASAIFRESDSIIVDVNEAFIHVTGFSREEILGKTTLELDLYENLSDRKKILEILHAKGIVENYEFKMKNKKGEIRYGIHTTILISLSGEMHYLSLILDITKRKEAENELKKLSQAVEQSPSSVIITNTNGEIQYVNPKFTKVTGYSKDEVIGENPRILKSGEMSKEIYTQLWQTISSGNEWSGEFYNKKKNGEMYWELASISPITNSEGKISHFVAVKEDVTSRKLAQKALLESEKKYRVVADNTYNWEFWEDEKGDYIYCSPSCLRITGYSAMEFVRNKNLKYVILHPEHKLTYINNLIDIRNEKNEASIQVKIIHKNGSIKWMENICHPVYDEFGEYLGIRGSNRDITETKETERKILNAIISTEEKERNRFSQELHDGLGPMLSTVKLYFEWLAEEFETNKRAKIIKTGITNINEAIEALREISNKLSPRVLNSLGLIPALKYLVHKINETQKIKVEIRYDKEMRYSTHIEVTLYRIFSELITNTIKYADAQVCEISIEHNLKAKIISAVYTDDGKGFDLNRVLAEEKGMGIHNVRQRIKTLNGKIIFDTDIGKPLKVNIELPLIEIEE